MKFLFFFFLAQSKKKDGADCQGLEDKEERGRTGLNRLPHYLQLLCYYRS